MPKLPTLQERIMGPFQSMMFRFVADFVFSCRLIEKDYLEREGNSYTYLA